MPNLATLLFPLLKFPYNICFATSLSRATMWANVHCAQSAGFEGEAFAKVELCLMRVSALTIALCVHIAMLLGTTRTPNL